MQERRLFGILPFQFLLPLAWNIQIRVSFQQAVVCIRRTVNELGAQSTPGCGKGETHTPTAAAVTHASSSSTSSPSLPPTMLLKSRSSHLLHIYPLEKPDTPREQCNGSY